MLRRVLPVLLLLGPGLAVAKKKPKAAAAPKAAATRLSDADCAKVAQHMLDLEVEDMRRTDESFRALSPAEQLAAVEEMRKDPEMQQLAKGCGSELTRADADCILRAKAKAQSEACVGPPAGEDGDLPPSEAPPRPTRAKTK